MALRDKLQRLSRGIEGVDAEELLTDWQEAIAKLYDFISESLDDYVKQNLGSITRRTVTRTEMTMGPYEIAELKFSSGPESIIFSPVGRLVVGATGRVDMYRQGNFGDGFTLLRQQEGIGAADLEWVIGMSARRNALMDLALPLLIPPGMSLTRLSKETLESSIDTLLM